MDIYSPVNPLPEDIQKMDRDETVCKFCGVSYLIHNEIKKLEEELKNCLDKVRMYDGLKLEYDQLRKNYEGISNELTESKGKYFDLTKMYNLSRESIGKLKSENLLLLEKIKTYEQEKGKLEKEVKKARGIYPTLLSMQKQIAILKNTKELYLSEMVNYQKGMKGFFAHLSLNFSDINKIMKKSSEVERSNAVQLSDLRGYVSKLEAEKEELLSRVDRLQRSSSSLSHTQDQNVKLSRLLTTTQSEVEKLASEISLIKEQKLTISDRMKSKTEENEELKDHLNSLTRKFTLQIDELNKKYKSSLSMQENLKSKISSHVLEYEGAIKEKEQNKHSKTELELTNQAMSANLNAVTSEYKKLVKQNENCVMTHQRQIEQLQQSYQNQLQEALSRRDSSETEVIQLKKLIEKLSREVAVRIEEAVHKAAVDTEAVNKKIIAGYESSRRDLEKQIDTLSDTYNSDLKSKHEAIVQLEKSYQLQFKDMRTDNLNLNNVIKSLKSHISEAEAKIAQLSSQPTSQGDESKVLSEQNAKLETEVLSLQRMVQRECEERLELTDALESARSQLASVRNVGSVSSRSGEKSTVSQVSSNGGGVAKNRRRIENTIGRMTSQRKGSVTNAKKQF